MALPFKLQANSSVVYDDAIMPFEDVLKLAVKQSDGQCELYHMLSTNWKTFEDCETKKCVLQQTAPMKYLAPERSAVRRLLEIVSVAVAVKSSKVRFLSHRAMAG